MLFADKGVSSEFVLGAVLVSLIAGALCGLGPLAVGAQKGRPGLGVTGFVACVGSGFLLGCLLAFPVGLFFCVLIALLDHPAPPEGGGEELGGKPFDPYGGGKRYDF